LTLYRIEISELLKTVITKLGSSQGLLQGVRELLTELLPHWRL